MLTPGTRLGPYEIVALVGEGGMGQVFKARDTRLDRTVAIKMLPASLAADPQRRERFEREARNISRLEHPHICPLYDVGEHDGHAYLVMQFLEGDTLAERLEHGPLTISQTLEYGIQIAEALAAAHRAGIVHRDLKPGNIMITRTGARLLDFGLARTVPGSTSLNTTLGDRAARVGRLTTEGTILGTLSYMAPEQIDGREIDTRADVFAFGAVLFEMLTGLKAFEGETPARVMSAILRDEPARVSSIVPVTPAALEALIHACLAKDPNERWQNISDVARQLRHLRDMMSGPRSGRISASGAMPAPAVVLAQPATAAAPTSARPQAGLRRRSSAPRLVGLVVDRMRSTAPPGSASAPLSLHALILPPEGMYLTDTLALSPDGRQLAFVAAEPTGRKRLWLRALDAKTPQSVADTDGASEPFWSPDGQQIAFFAGGRLKRVAAAGGGVTTICDAGTTAGGSWNRDDVIVFARQDGPMMRVAAGGGRPEPLTAFDRERGETHHLYPAFLPDGRHYTYYVNSRERGVYVGELGSTTRTRLFDPDPALPAGGGGHAGDLLARPATCSTSAIASDGAPLRSRGSRGERRAGDARADRGLRPARAGGVHDGGGRAGLSREPASAARGAGLGRSGGHGSRRHRVAAGCVSHDLALAGRPHAWRSTGATRRACRRCGSWTPLSGTSARLTASLLERRSACGRQTAGRSPTASPPTRRRISSSAASAARAPSDG